MARLQHSTSAFCTTGARHSCNTCHASTHFVATRRAVLQQVALVLCCNRSHCGAGGRAARASRERRAPARSITISMTASQAAHARTHTCTNPSIPRRTLPQPSSFTRRRNTLVARPRVAPCCAVLQHVATCVRALSDAAPCCTIACGGATSSVGGVRRCLTRTRQLDVGRRDLVDRPHRPALSRTVAVAP